MERKIIVTSDGSKSLYLPDLDETYHSRHGAVQEAYHVFIRNGLDLYKDGSELRILEMGFGTGLNCFITWLESRRRTLTVHYRGLEAFPVAQNIIDDLDYPVAVGREELRPLFDRLHQVKWDANMAISEGFNLRKEKKRFDEFDPAGEFDLVYFDAFGPRVQPELWNEAMFQTMYDGLKPGGVLVTYSAKGSVRRAMQAVGFGVERLPGPPGKREMLRATKVEK
jgi:tRNA U34 5-methylaminomethyl-2-thiouridine-forming methyltransferase MnmC